MTSAAIRPKLRNHCRRLLAFFEAIAWVPITESIARRAGDLARAYRRSHRGIDAADYLIAATALALDAPLLTCNLRHFPMFDRLERPY